MVFSSLSFLFVFFPILMVIYIVVPAKCKHARQYVLLFFSILFYGSGEPLYVYLIITCITLSWILSEYVKERCKWALITAIFVNVLPLIITKYIGFIVCNICNLFRITSITIPSIVMPIGISFYTFQVITYIVDLYAGKVDRQRNLLLFALYILFFPQLIAGPIVKYSEVSNELEHPRVNWGNIKYGTCRFIRGLGKKVLIANQVGYIASTIKESPFESITTGMAWLAVVAFTIQIYFDFSGYSEMAIGLGAIFGFRFPENFNDPYISISITEFWRRWHITLGRFFREYVYIPLGGNRVSKTRWIINIFIVWFLTGLWHGASWNFVIWGMYYGIIIIFERMLGINKILPKQIMWAITFLLVNLGWAIFMYDNVSLIQMLGFLARLFGFGADIITPVTIGSLNLWGHMPFLIVGFLVTTPLWALFIRNNIKCLCKKNEVLTGIFNDVSLIMILIFSLIFIMGGTYNPFIYYRF